ncbi:MAG: hypothetical protein COC24_004560 [Alphaproteobacteria bacterium]|nr:hypothetical protein [Alphaproteobacteria bacterium]
MNENDHPIINALNKTIYGEPLKYTNLNKLDIVIDEGVLLENMTLSNLRVFIRIAEHSPIGIKVKDLHAEYDIPLHTIEHFKGKYGDRKRGALGICELENVNNQHDIIRLSKTGRPIAERINAALSK